MAHQAEDISKIEDIGERLDALLDALEESSEEVARASSSLDDDAPPPARKKREDPKAAPEAKTVAQPETVAESRAPTEHPQESEETSGPAAEADAEPVIDDGLLIEPEAKSSPVTATDDVDGAPVGSDDLERQLDEELASLLASGVFEDPVGEMGTDESAEPVELPEEDADADADADAGAEAELLESTAVPERKPNLPTDEAELIGELDEQLAALADAQLDADEPTPEPIAPAPEAPIEPESAEVQAPEPEPAEAPAPEPVPEPAAPAATPAPTPVPAANKPAWRAAADRVFVVAGPVVVRVANRTGDALIVGARRASAPLDSKPQLKQIVGWVALVQAFLATCVWVYLALWHSPPQPPTTPQPTLQVPTDG